MNNIATNDIKQIKQNITYDPKCIFDIGANIGDYTLGFAQEFTNAKIYAFEPIKSTYDMLVNNTKDDDGISTYNFGFLEHETDCELGMPKNHYEKRVVANKVVHNLFSRMFVGPNDYCVQTCHFKNIDSFCKENDIFPDFLKIDVEGCEFEILESISKDVADKVRSIYIEVNVRLFPDQHKINNLLLGLGFNKAIPPIDYRPKERMGNLTHNRFWDKV